MLTSSVRSEGATTIVRSVVRLFYGTVFIVLDISINGLDLIPDIVGMLLVLSACENLLKLDPGDLLGRIGAWTAMGTTALTAFWTVPDWRSSAPVVETLISLLSSLGITAVAFFLHRLTRAHAIDRASDQWLLAGKAQIVAGLMTIFHLLLAPVVGETSLVPDFASSEPGLIAVAVTATVTIIVVLVSAVLWLRAAWTTWKTAESDAASGGLISPSMLRDQR